MPHFEFEEDKHQRKMEEEQEYYDLLEHAQSIVAEHGKKELVKLTCPELFACVAAELKKAGINCFHVPQTSMSSDWIKGLYTWDRKTHYVLLGTPIPSSYKPAF